jgi:hypothetical protein
MVFMVTGDSLSGWILDLLGIKLAGLKFVDQTY